MKSIIATGFHGARPLSTTNCQASETQSEMESVPTCHTSSQTDNNQTGRQKPELEKSEGVAGGAVELTFPQHHYQHQQQVRHQREHHQDQDRSPQTAQRCANQPQFITDAISTVASASSQPHYYPHCRHLSQHQLQGHNYFINDLLSSTAASSSISSPDLAIASSMQLLNGKLFSYYYWHIFFFG